MIPLARARLERLLQTFDVEGVNWTAAGPPALRSPHLHLSYWSSAWFGHNDERPPTRHVGGVAPVPAQPLEGPPPPHDAPWVFITLGTSFNDDPAFFAAAAQAVERLGGAPIVAAGPGRALQAELHRRLPATAHIFETVDFRATLPYVRAAIHHGGAGVTHALVTHGVPQIVTPHAADQGRQAQGVARTGVGYHIAPRQATAANLANALAQLLPDRSPQRAAAVELQAEFATLGGIQRAADWVEQLKAF
jgi:UDP:flavonoid glycosyltransferase YjiC (YdhE family)